MGGIVSDWIGVQPFLLYCGIGMLVIIITLQVLPGKLLHRLNDRHDPETVAEG